MGFVIGAFVMLSGSALADEISMIGKTVQGQFPVTVDGETLETPAIVIDGTSFLPVRKFGEVTGYEVSFDPDGEIILNKILTEEQLAELEDLKNQPYYPDGKTPTDEQVIEKDEQQVDVMEIKEEIKRIDEKINDYKKSLDASEELLILSEHDGLDTESTIRSINETKEKISELEAQKNELELLIEQTE